MTYRERELTSDERLLAAIIRDHVPRDVRLLACQKVAAVSEGTQERVAMAFPPTFQEARVAAWQAGIFPRYRFMDAAMPGAGWLQCAGVPGVERLAVMPV